MAAVLTALAATPAVFRAELATQTQAGPPQATFRAGTVFIEVDARVTDAQGRFVRDLTPDDFVVTEDGKPQKVETLALVDLPVTIDRSPPRDPYSSKVDRVEADVATNAGPPGHLYLIVLDTFHVDASRSPYVRRRAREFVEHYLGPTDMAAIVHIGHPTLNQELTTNKTRMIVSIDKFIGEKTIPASLAIANADPILTDIGVPPDRDRRSRPILAMQFMTQMEHLASFLATIDTRRKALVLFSEGLDVDLDAGAVMGDPLLAEAFTEEQRMFATMSRSNASIYAVDPRGVADNDELMQAQSANGVSALAELRAAQQSMRMLAENTNGLAAVGTNDFTRSFTNIVEDNSGYYLLGYRSANTARDGKFHSLKVRMARPGLEVRARPGYYADTPAGATAAPKPADPLSDVLAHPAAPPGLRMRAGAAAITGAKNKKQTLIQLVVELDPRDLTLASDNGVFADDVELLVSATNHFGDLKSSSRETVKLRLAPDTRAALDARGFRFTTEFELPPDRYQLRLAAREPATARAGTAYLDLDVPDFSDGPLVMGGLIVTTPDATATPSATKADSLARSMPGPATTRRAFGSAETIGVFAEIVDNDRPAHRMTMTTTVRDANGAAVFHTDGARDAPALTGPNGADARRYGYLSVVPLKGLEPGRFTVTVDVRSSRGNGSLASRAIRDSS